MISNPVKATNATGNAPPIIKLLEKTKPPITFKSVGPSC